MLPDFAPRLNALAEVVVRIGLNLQAGQKLLIAEPYELQGVDRVALPFVEVLQVAAGRAGTAGVEIIWGDGIRLRELAEKKEWSAFSKLTATNARKLDTFVTRGDALLFLPGSQPKLMAGLPAELVAQFRQISWEHFGPVAQRLIQSATNWTAAPAPSPAWADAVYGDLPAGDRLDALWRDVFAAMKIPAPEATGQTQPAPSRENPVRSQDETIIATWRSHLDALGRKRDELNAMRARTLRYLGEGTDLTVILPAGHRWCTATLATGAGVSFVANLPTEEVFTLPHKNSAAGVVRVARPISYGGGVIDGITLEFQRGEVIKADARDGKELLRRMLDTDEGARRLGEVAVVERRSPVASTAPEASWQDSGRFFHQALLDENASNHIALGEGYSFCLQSPDTHAVNRSLIHVDLPLDAQVHFHP